MEAASHHLVFDQHFKRFAAHVPGLLGVHVELHGPVRVAGKQLRYVGDVGCVGKFFAFALRHKQGVAWRVAVSGDAGDAAHHFLPRLELHQLVC